MAKLTESVNSV